MQNVFITGSNGNLASGLIPFLTAEGYVISGCDLDAKDSLKVKKAQVNGLKSYYQCDITKEGDIENLFISLRNENNFPDILINNAAIDSVPIKGKRSDGLDTGDFKSIMEVNVLAPILFSKECINYWKQKKINGNILNISSIYSVVSPDPNIYSDGFVKNIFYGMTKASLNSITKQMAVITAKDSIRVNAVLFAGIPGENQDPIFVEKYKARIPIGRFLERKEAYELISFVISDRNTYMTGELVKLDGGYCSI